MDEKEIPIDITTNKLVEWLISRRHVPKDWQNNILNVREKINNALQDMPAHEGIIKLLSGQHINYFHCLKIVEILKKTEADSKNLFGRYGSQRMKDWQDIISCYQKDNIYLAEAAQLLIRNVNYEIPGLRKQVAKLEQTQVEAEKKIKDYRKIEANTLKEFNICCQQLGICGRNIKVELLELLKELPKVYKVAAERIKLLKEPIEFYRGFVNFCSSGKSEAELLITPLGYLVENGNTTTYEYKFGKKPSKIEEDEIEIVKDGKCKADDEIDFGDDDSLSTKQEIDFGDNIVQEIDFGDFTIGNTEAEPENGDEGFEIVDISLEESGIVVEKSGNDGDIARGTDALSILDNPEIRCKIIDCLMELDTFLKLRLYEMSCDSDILSITQMEDAPNVVSLQTIESVTAFSGYITMALNELTNKRIFHLHNIKHSPKYVDILTGNLAQKLSVIEKMKANSVLLEKKIFASKKEIRDVEKIFQLLVEKTKQLQKDIQGDISFKYQGRIVNIVGSVSML